MCIIHGCFDHFHHIFPPLGKMRAHRDLHRARLDKIPEIWRQFTSSITLQEIEPLDLVLPMDGYESAKQLLVQASLLMRLFYK